MLNPQDIVVMLKVYCLNSEWTYAELAESLKTSTSVVHDALQRCDECHLYNVKKRIVFKGALEEFLVNGLKYVFVTGIGTMVRGIPTAHSAEPLKSLFVKKPINGQ
jgi:hypothetical protein